MLNWMYFSSDPFIQEFIKHVKKNDRGLVIKTPKNVNLSVFGPPKKIKTVKMKNDKEACKPVQHVPVENTIGIDCEMVEANHGRSVLARVAVVTRDEILLNTFVLPCDISEITDYNTEISGVTPEDLYNAPRLDQIIPIVKSLLDKAKIIVGHGLDHDMAVLGFQVPEEKVRDTSLYRPFLKNGGKSSSLKGLTKKYLKEEIQVSYY